MTSAPLPHEADSEQLRDRERSNLWALLKGEPLPGDSALLWSMLECAIRLPNLAPLPRGSQVAAILSADDEALKSAWATRNQAKARHRYVPWVCNKCGVTLGTVAMRKHKCPKPASDLS